MRRRLQEIQRFCVCWRTQILHPALGNFCILHWTGPPGVVLPNVGLPAGFPSVPHYFLHVRDGDYLRTDDEGERLRDLEAARAEALAIAREMWAEVLREGEDRDYLDAVILITDRQNRELMSVSFVEALPPRLRSRLAGAG